MFKFYKKIKVAFETALLGAPIVIIHEFHKPPYGGGNQFLLALKNEWEKMGLTIGAGKVGQKTETVLFNSFNFDFNVVRNARKKNIRMIHRVDGPIGAYRGVESKEDREIWQINHECADATIFQSRYSYEKHLEMGLEFKNPVIITNAVNHSIFYPKKDKALKPGKKIKLIATSWSNNPKKGAKTYQWLDANLDKAKYEFTFVGRISVDLPQTRVIPAVDSGQLADILREHDIYVTASEHDPCSNALIEALSCGLPALHLKSGGHPELVQNGGIGFDHSEEIPALLEKLATNYDQYVQQIKVSNISDVAQKYLKVMQAQSS